jgi:hypothetical protein
MTSLSSDSLGLTPRQLEIGELLADNLTVKAIAARTGMSTVQVYGQIRAAAERLGGCGPPTRRLALFFLRYGPGEGEGDQDDED